MDTPGTLILVATPIGNLGDISARATDTLRNADVIYCEDTRHSRQLLTHLEIRGQKLISLHEHNEAERAKEVLERLAGGQMVVLVSDAGMPVVSDPGQRLVAAVSAAGYAVTAIPGPNAALMALAISGLPAERFRFEGFLPIKGKERAKRLDAIATSPDAVIIYEAPQRLAKTIADLNQRYGSDRRVAIARELTKLHEEIWRGALEEASVYLETATLRGEYALVLEGVCDEKATSDDQIIAIIREEMDRGASTSQAAQNVAASLGLPRKRVYTLALTIPSYKVK